MEQLALVVQCYAKTDTLQRACESLLRCTGREAVDLILWSDSPIGGHLPGKYEPLAQEVQYFIDGFLQKHGSAFRSVTRQSNPRNLGTCRTCEAALDFAFDLHPFVVFSEDDVVFSRDALLWFDSIRRTRLFGDEHCWAIAGESVFFDAGGRTIPPGWPARMRSLALEEDLVVAYTTHQFVPSTCFATTREKWREFGRTRGLPTGDVDVCQRCSAEGRHAIFPIVPRVKDIGMLHEHGYSVMLHSREGVSELKNTYLTSDDLLPDPMPQDVPYGRYEGNSDRLYAMTTQMSS